MGVAILLTFVISLSAAMAQESVNAAGSNASGSGGSTNYSVGQIVYTTNTETNGSVAQGVQQPCEISVVTAIEEAKGILVSAYPNPVTEYLTLSIEEFEISNLSYQLYDMQGKPLQNKKITSKQTCIIMNNLVSAKYFVKVIQNNKEVKTFKIVKK